MAIDRWPRVFPVSGKTKGGKDTLWLQLKVRELLSQTMDVRNAGGIKVGNSVIKTMQFLLPMSYGETINHNWEDVDTLANKLGEKYRSIAQKYKEAKGTIRMKDNAANFLRTQADTAIRPDSPTIFRASQKRDIPLTFHLADQGDTERDVFEPVNLLMYYSSSGIKETEIGEHYFKINYPYVFELQTINGIGEGVPLIYFQHAAITSIQPTYFGPYRNGYPTKCELTLNFQDLQPLFKKTFENASSKVTSSVQ